MIQIEYFLYQKSDEKYKEYQIELKMILFGFLLYNKVISYKEHSNLNL